MASKRILLNFEYISSPNLAILGFEDHVIYSLPDKQSDE